MDILFSNFYANRALHSILFGDIALRHRLSMTELVILLFLHLNPDRNTARDIVQTLKVAKSHVSFSVRDLETRGMLTGTHSEDNRRSIRLSLEKPAESIIREGLLARDRFIEIVTEGFSAEDLERFADCMTRAT